MATSSLDRFGQTSYSVLAMLKEKTKADSLVVKQGHGSWFTDSKRREILNLSASALGLPLGYGNDIVRSAVLEALETNVPGLTGCLCEHDACGRLGAILAAFKPHYYDRTTLMLPSSDHALGAAVRLAFEHTRRRHVIAVSGVCHGSKLGSLSYGERPLSFGSLRCSWGDLIRLPFPGSPGSTGPACTATESFVSMLEEFVFKQVAHPYDIAALVVPPISFAEGLSVVPDDFFPTASKLCLQAGILLVVDETRLSIGVSGKRFAIDWWDVQPDVLCLGEGCTNGFSFGAAVVLRSLLDFDLSRVAGLSQCQTVACAAVIAVLKQEAKLSDKAQRIEGYLSAELNRLKESCALVESVAGKGALWSISLVHEAASDMKNLTLRDQVADMACERGLFIAKTGNRSLIVAPPLVISDAELERAVHILAEVLMSLVSGPSGV